MREEQPDAWIEYYQENIAQGNNYILGDLSVYRRKEELR